MKLPVIWLNYHPDAICRGYWDQSLIEDLFAEQIWHVPGGFTFEHYDQGLWPDGDTVVVVIPGRHNAHFVEKINQAMLRYQAVLFIFTGDEEALFPWWLLNHGNRRVWAMGARPDKREGVDQPLGSGYSPDFPILAATELDLVGTTDVFFCGQVTHSRREACLEATRHLPGLAVYTVPTVRFLADGSPDKGGMKRESYASCMSNTKLALAPAGPESPDSFRLYEALEAGAVPLADEITPHGPVDGYWEYVFGGSVPFPIVQDWALLPKLAEGELADWPANAARISAFWQQWKRRLAYRLHSDLRVLRQRAYGPIIEIDEFSDVEAFVTAWQALPVPDQAPDDLITVIIPTCPVPSHPDTTMIETVVASVREQLPEAEIIIACDGMRPSFTEHQDAYNEHLLRLTRLCEQWHNVVPVILDEWGHQSGGTRAALKLVMTPLVLFVEHDTPLTGDIPWTDLAHTILAGDIGMIRLNHQTDIHPDHQHMMLDNGPRHYGPNNVPLARTTQWSQRPHLASTAMYRDRIMPLFGDHGCTYIEWIMHSAIQHGIENGVEETWEKWKVAIYHPEGNIQRSLHLDGRAGASLEDSLAAYEELQQ